MTKLIGVELFKIYKRRMTWVLLGVLIFYMLLGFLGTYFAVTSLPESPGNGFVFPVEKYFEFPGAFTMVFSTAQGIGIILLIILSASIVGNEYSWGTIQQMLTRQGIRSRYLGSKIIALAIIAVISVLISLILGTALACFTTSRLTGGINLDFLSASLFGEIAKMFVWTVFTIMVYVMLAILFTILGRSAVVGMAVGLGYYFVEGIAISIFNQAGGWLVEIPHYLMGQNVQALVFIEVNRMTVSPPSPLHATVVLLLYCFVFLAASFYFFRKRDITA